MSDQLVDVRTPLARSANARVEIGQDGVIHVLAGPVTLHLDRSVCEELTTTLARAMVRLATMQTAQTAAVLFLVTAGDEERADDHEGSKEPPLQLTRHLPSQETRNDQSRNQATPVQDHRLRQRSPRP